MKRIDTKRIDTGDKRERATVRDFVASWTHGEPWRTWIAHAAIALLLAALLGWKLAVGYYALREAEQVFYRIVNKDDLEPVDHVMDVAAPALAVLAAWLIIELTKGIAA